MNLNKFIYRSALRSIILLYVISFSAITLNFLSPHFLYATPITQFEELKELKGRSDGFEDQHEKEDKWFQADSNYGRIFLEPKSMELVVSWLGTVSRLYSVEIAPRYRTRSYIKLTANYHSRRREDTPIRLSLLAPHPRSMTSRTLNLIPEFSELEAKAKNSPINEQLDIAGFPAQLGLDFEKGVCRLYVPIAQQSAIYLETLECQNRKKLLDFCETIDIARLSAKLEK